MQVNYTDQQGIIRDLVITYSDHLVGMVYTINRDGAFYCELVQNSDGSWREVLDGSTPRSTEYGKLLDHLFPA